MADYDEQGLTFKFGETKTPHSLVLMNKLMDKKPDEMLTAEDIILKNLKFKYPKELDKGNFILRNISLKKLKFKNGFLADADVTITVTYNGEYLK